MQHGSTLYTLGISYYAHGTIKQGRQVQGYFYKLCKPATAEQLQAARAIFPHMHTGKARSQYAPEICANVLIFSSKAALKRQGVQA
jgi:hypothetical protein